MHLVAGTANINHVQVMLLDQTIQVDINKIQPRRRPPVTEQSAFDVIELQWLAQQRIVGQVNLNNREIIRRAPLGVDPPQSLGSQRISYFHFNGSHSRHHLSSGLLKPISTPQAQARRVPDKCGDSSASFGFVRCSTTAPNRGR